MCLWSPEPAWGFHPFLHTQTLQQILEVPNRSPSAGRCVLRHLMNRGHDWLLHLAAGTFDLWLWGHVMKEIYIGAERCWDQTASRAELRYSLPRVKFICNRYFGNQQAHFREATGVPVQMLCIYMKVKPHQWHSRTKNYKHILPNLILWGLAFHFTAASDL